MLNIRAGLLVLLSFLTNLAFFLQFTQALPSLQYNSSEAVRHYQDPTQRQMIKTLREKGYHIQESAGGTLIVLLGDIAYDPQSIVRNRSEVRLTNFMKTPLWIDSTGIARTRYFFDNETSPDKETFIKATQSWINKTCIRFDKLPDGPCTQNISEPCICVGKFEGCWSYVGVLRPKGGKPQKMSVGNGCSLYAGAHEFGHALGFAHEQSRPDRNKFIVLNCRNFGFEPTQDGMQHERRHGWATSDIQDHPVDLPIPYDYLSIMQYGTTDFGNEDNLPIIVTKDVRNQYMLNYKSRAVLLQSHYDLYSVNVMYGCEKQWRKSCIQNGKSPPKCRNHGFVGKTCECVCPTGFGGPSCENKKGPIFPRLPKAKIVIEVQETSIIDLKQQTMSLSKEQLYGPYVKMESRQYLTIVADGKDGNTRVCITGSQALNNFQVPKYIQNYILGKIGLLDCTHMFIWGISIHGRLRTDCLSTVARNESDGPWFHGRTNHLDMYVEAYFGEIFSRPDMSLRLVQMNMTVVFAPRPDKVMQVLKKSPGLLGSAARMVSAAASSGTVAGAVTVAIVALAAAALGFRYYRVKKSAAEAAAAGSTSGSGNSEEVASSGEESVSNAGSDAGPGDNAENGKNSRDHLADEKEPDEEETTDQDKESKEQRKGYLAILPSLW